MTEKLQEMLYLPNDFLPTKKKQIDEKHGKKFGPMKLTLTKDPEKNPNDSQMESFLKRINMF